MLVPVLLFLVGFALLIKGGDWFVDGAVGIAHRLPEVMVSAQAAAEGNAGISYGNAIGSIICNTSLIAALTVAIRPGKVDPKSFRLPTAFFFAAALSYALIAWTLGKKASRPGGRRGRRGEQKRRDAPVEGAGAACRRRGGDRARRALPGRQRHAHRGRARRARQRDRPDDGRPRHQPAGADHRHYQPYQGTRRALARQHHRRSRASIPASSSTCRSCSPSWRSSACRL